MNNQTNHISEQNRALGYLKGIIIVMLVAFHSIIAYALFTKSIPSPSSFLAEPRLWRVFPIIDSQTWSGFSVYFFYFNSFAMALMFFISGLFVWNSLLRKGSSIFLRDRFIRLGFPFVILSIIEEPLRYYPAYLAIGENPQFSVYLSQWVTQSDWPNGYLWFLWLLLAFNCIVVIFFYIKQKKKQSNLNISPNIIQHPAAFFGIVIAASAAAYIPVANIFGTLTWSNFGPFSFQTSRIFFYAIYFLSGTMLGAIGIEKGLLATDGRLAKRWPIWVVSAFISFVIYLSLVVKAFSESDSTNTVKLIIILLFLLCCAASVFAFLSLFLKFVRKSNRVLDSLQNNAYGIFLFHFIFVTWLQYALLNVKLSAIAKGSIVFICSLAISWGISACLRRIPAFARVI